MARYIITLQNGITRQVSASSEMAAREKVRQQSGPLATFGGAGGFNIVSVEDITAPSLAAGTTGDIGVGVPTDINRQIATPKAVEEYLKAQAAGDDDEERLEKERLEKERLEKERLEKERLAEEGGGPLGKKGLPEGKEKIFQEQVFDPNVLPPELTTLSPDLDRGRDEKGNWKGFKPNITVKGMSLYKRLIEHKQSRNGTTYRLYEYSFDENFSSKVTEEIAFLVSGDGVFDYTSPQKHEIAITPDAYRKGRGGLNLIELKATDFIPLIDKVVTPMGQASTITNALARDSKKDKSNIPAWLREVLRLGNRGIVGRSDEKGNITYSFDMGATSETVDVEVFKDSDEVEFSGKPTEETEAEREERLKITKESLIEKKADEERIVAKGDEERIVAKGDEIVGVEPAEGLKGFTLDKFLTDIGFAVPKDATGRTVPMDRFTSLPGFPAELLAPENLYIKITSSQDVLDELGNVIGKQYVTNFEPNPAIEAALQLYGDRVRALTNLQGSADDILAAQITATRGMAGPADGLTPQQLENLERETATIAASGGKLASEITRDAEGAIKDISYNLTPLGRQELAQEALRATGGLSGGYYQPVIDKETGIPVTDPTTGEIIQEFVPGFDPTELAAQRALEERGGFEVPEVLAQIQAQNVPAIFQAQLEAQRQSRDARLARQQQSIQQLAQIYQNPAALAGLVASGGSPLLAQLQAQAQGQGQGVQGSIPLDQAGTGPLGINQLYQNIFNTLGLKPGEQQDQQTNVLAPSLTNVESQVTTGDELRREQDEMRTDMQRGYVRVIDPNTGQQIEIRPAREGGPQKTELITDAYGNERTVIVPGSYFEMRVPGTNQTQNRFIRNDQLGTYSIDASQYTQLSQDPYFKGPSIEDIGYSPEDIERASVMVQPPPTPIDTEVPPVPTASPFDNITEQQLSRMSVYEKLALTGRRAAYGEYPEDIAKAAEKRTPAPPGSPSTGFWGILAPSPIGKKSVTGGGYYSPSFTG